MTPVPLMELNRMRDVPFDRVIAAKVLPAFAAKIHSAAEAEGATISDYLRGALRDRLRQTEHREGDQ
jgi:hypothetical protein